MQTTSRLFDDLAKVASGAVSTFGAVKEEVETRVKERVERLMAEMDLPTADEVAAVRAMAQKSRDEQDRLMERIAALEARVAALENPASEIA
ncbi:MAG TPA: accessory factor UbiK family protein [Geminicoccus sp.]|jgi:BMFP domain-containing protein YqiC|uniref:accessory factor UbiK family protein n=1 Tax=Geminicoccus sp. TaxID=2024832 RepID=UPI002E318463|nr:accessory factor UbiK family protein [Geminicoccus sp.]HEX2528745.1 accessory factor UbiK family protein [Geminicoccus sp.]